MISLLFGEDTFRSRKKLREIIAEEERKERTHSTVERFDAEEDDLTPLATLGRASSLFGEKRVIVVEHAISHPAGFTFVRSFAPMWQKNSDLLLLWDGTLEGEAGERINEIRPLLASVFEFPPLALTALRRWIQEEAKERGIALSPAEMEEFLARGGNLWAAANELEKRALHAPPWGRSQGAGVRTVFELGDTFFSAPRAALRILLELLDQGENEIGLFSFLANHARLLLLVKSAPAGGIRPPKAGKLHPYRLRKAAATARTLSEEQLRGFLERFFEEEHRIKIGASKPKDSLLRMLTEKIESGN